VTSPGKNHGNQLQEVNQEALNEIKKQKSSLSSADRESFSFIGSKMHLGMANSVLSHDQQQGQRDSLNSVANGIFNLPSEILNVGAAVFKTATDARMSAAFKLQTDPPLATLQKEKDPQQTLSEKKLLTNPTTGLFRKFPDDRKQKLDPNRFSSGKLEEIKSMSPGSSQDIGASRIGREKAPATPAEKPQESFTPKEKKCKKKRKRSQTAMPLGSSFG
jgi:hypothetical protein